MVLDPDKPSGERAVLSKKLDEVEGRIRQLSGVRDWLREQLGIRDPLTAPPPPSLVAAVDSALRSAGHSGAKASAVVAWVKRLDNKPACAITIKTVTRCLIDNASERGWERRDEPGTKRGKIWFRPTPSDSRLPV